MHSSLGDDPAWNAPGAGTDMRRGELHARCGLGPRAVHRNGRSGDTTYPCRCSAPSPQLLDHQGCYVASRGGRHVPARTWASSSGRWMGHCWSSGIHRGSRCLTSAQWTQSRSPTARICVPCGGSMRSRANRTLTSPSTSGCGYLRSCVERSRRSRSFAKPLSHAGFSRWLPHLGLHVADSFLWRIDAKKSVRGSSRCLSLRCSPRWS